MATPSPSLKPRVLVFVVAYEAESTLARVLARIPPTIWELDVEVLVIDDSSRDRTFEVGLRTAESVDHCVTILYNRENQGYGGNQKLGYAYALRHGFDYVVLLHGDGQYAPESIPDLLAPLLDGLGDAVLGSRMMIPGAARQGGMPLYKFIGNKILTWVQNGLLGQQLSEFHSGFRAYRVAALGQLPFQYNSNAFHFDTEIIIQFLLAGFRIVEVPIPTYYGDEICRVNGLRYAKDVLLVTLGSRLHGLSVLYDRKFDVGQPENRRYQLKLGYRSSHSMVLEAVPDGARVLDVGCGPGDFAQELRKKGCTVDGADQFVPVQPSPFRDFLLWKEPERLDVDLRRYDYVLLLDVVEHLKEPERFLDAMRQASSSLDRPPQFVVTTGNVVFAVVRLQALLGNFNYGRRGILDLTHTRLYTFKSLRQLFEQCGFRIERIEGIPAPFPLAVGLNWWGRALVNINSLLIRLSRGLFSFQVFLIASPLPTVDALLDDAVAMSAERRESRDRLDAVQEDEDGAPGRVHHRRLGYGLVVHVVKRRRCSFPCHREGPRLRCRYAGRATTNGSRTLGERARESKSSEHEGSRGSILGLSVPEEPCRMDTQPFADGRSDQPPPEGVREPSQVPTARRRGRCRLSSSELVMLVGVGLLGLVLRLDGITSSLWLDEFGTLWVVEGTVKETWRRAVDFQGQSPLYYLTVWLTVRILGESEFSMRLPSLAFGIVAVGVVALTASRVGGARAGVLAAGMSWLAFPFVMASANARPYSLALAAAAGMYYGFIRSALQGDRWGRWLWALSGACLAWAHYVQYGVVSGLVLAYAACPALRARWPTRLFAADTALQAALVTPVLPHVAGLVHRREVLSWLSGPDYLGLLHVLAPFLLPILMHVSTRKPADGTTEYCLTTALLLSLLSQLLVLLALLWGGGVNLVTSRYALVAVVPAVLLASVIVARLTQVERYVALIAFAIINVAVLGRARAITGSFSGRQEEWRGAVEALRARLDLAPGAPVLFRSGFVEDDAVMGGEAIPATLSPLRSPGRPPVGGTILRLPFRWAAPGRLQYLERSVAPRLNCASVAFALGLDRPYFERLVEWINERWPGQFEVITHQSGVVQFLEFRQQPHLGSSAAERCEPHSRREH